jgi:hypothetical protein
MLVFWEQRLVLLATPKTGTTSIAKALESRAAISIQRPPELKHTPVKRFRRFIGPYLEQVSKEPFTVIGVMREPRDWLGSWYRYRQRPGIPDKRRSTAGMSFDTFVQAHCTEKPPAFANVGAQAGFLRPEDAKGVDLIFRHDRIGDLVSYLEDRLATTITLPVVNVSPKAETTLSATTEALLHRFSARDFELYAGLQ